MPDVCKFVQPADVVALSKKDALITILQTTMANTRNACFDKMVQHVSVPIAKQQVRAFEMQLMRLALGKDPLPSLFQIDQCGRMDSYDKTKVVVQKWLSHVQRSVPSLGNIMEECGVSPISDPSSSADGKKTGAGTGLDDVLEPSNFQDNAFVKGVTESLEGLGFKLGCKVKLTKRITITFSHYHKGSSEKPKLIRKDMVAGTVSRVKGVANDWPVLNFTSEIPKVGELTADVAVNPDKMKVMEDDDGGAGEEDDDEDAAPGIGLKTAVPRGHAFLREGGGKKVELVQKWPSRVSSKDQALVLANVHHHIGVAMSAVSGCLAGATSYKTHRYIASPNCK